MSTSRHMPASSTPPLEAAYPPALLTLPLAVLRDARLREDPGGERCWVCVTRWPATHAIGKYQTVSASRQQRGTDGLDVGWTLRDRAAIASCGSAVIPEPVAAGSECI
jgi:hypothetical protein